MQFAWVLLLRWFNETGYARGREYVLLRDRGGFCTKALGPPIDQSSMQQWRWQWAAGQQCFIKTCIEFERADELAETERVRQDQLALSASLSLPPLPPPFSSSSVLRIENDGHVWLKRRKVCPTLSNVVVLFVRRKRKQRKEGIGGGGERDGEEAAEPERDRKREDRLPGLNWNCHVRASEANQRKNNLYRIEFNCA